MTKFLTALVLAAIGLPNVASATDLTPEAAHSIRLGEYGGIVYYSPKRAGFRVVATIASSQTDKPIRITADMKSGDRLLISVPQGAGEPAISTVIYREGNSLMVTEPAAEPPTAAVEEASARTVVPR